MSRRVFHVYVFPYTDNGRRRALAFCSQDCGNNALADPPASWDTFRQQIARALLDVVSCHGCGLTIGETVDA